MTGRSGPASPRTVQVRLGALALVSLVAGALPWISDGPLVAKVLGIPFLAIGLFAGYAAYRYPAVNAEAEARSIAAYPVEPVGGCACGEGGCCGGAASAESVDLSAKVESDSPTVAERSQ